MERLTQTSNEGGLAFTFDLDITCEESEKRKIAKLGERLKEYEDLEEQRLLLRLPCKVGDTIFYLNGKLILEYEVTGFAVDRTGAWLVYVEHYAGETDKAYGYSFDVDKIGKTVFLTKEEAEQALKDMESEEK